VPRDETAEEVLVLFDEGRRSESPYLVQFIEDAGLQQP
jgi:hypothetical protein